MNIRLKGPLTDTVPPLTGQVHKWKFVNNTGEDIYFLNTALGPDNTYPPKLRRILVNVGEETSFLDVFSEPITYSIQISELFSTRDCIKPNEIFEIEMAFSDTFKHGNYIHFSPADKRNCTIISAINSSVQQNLEEDKLSVTNINQDISSPNIEPYISEFIENQSNYPIDLEEEEEE